MLNIVTQSSLPATMNNDSIPRSPTSPPLPKRAEQVEQRPVVPNSESGTDRGGKGKGETEGKVKM